jgi:CHAT domain-containing protein
VFVGGIAAEGDPHPEYFERDADILISRAPDLTKGFGVEGAARSRLLEILPQHDIIHLSCHGFFDRTDPMESGLLVSNGRRAPPRDPWSLSVLERGGFLLTARDLVERRIHARLVTLNACSSGLQGERNAGDELDGFARALLLAGAESVLLTLWNVDQVSSSEFLARFYERWLDPACGVPRWRAFNEAQTALLTAQDEYLRHPYHWAPYALLGDWQ